jgi:chaperone required for assembly of F1-ATPase
MPIPPPLPQANSKTPKKLKIIPTKEDAQAPNIESRLDEVQNRMDLISNMSKEEFDERYAAFNEREAKRARTAIRDDVFQMTVSDKSTTDVRQLKTFWKEVDVTEAGDGWYYVTLDGRKVKALESNEYLLLPSEEMAYAVAHEWAQQTGTINKLLMPMNDIASGCQIVDEFAVNARIEHLMSFFNTDNMYYRQENLKEQQEKLCDPVCDWFDKHFQVTTPRNFGLMGARPSDAMREKVHRQLLDMKMNKYQVVSLYVITQYTASIVLALALAHGAVDLPTALQINRLEEWHNVDATVAIDGYHDIRDADLTVKVSAAVACWMMTKGLTVEQTATPIDLITSEKKRKG